MICAACSHAGSMIDVADPQKIEALHAMCVYPKSCTCQHMTTSLVEKSYRAKRSEVEESTRWPSGVAEESGDRGNSSTGSNRESTDE